MIKNTRNQHFIDFKKRTIALRRYIINLNKPFLFQNKNQLLLLAAICAAPG